MMKIIEFNWKIIKIKLKQNIIFINQDTDIYI
jgi:hypothetical protein